jgi:hypothetical protein
LKKRRIKLKSQAEAKLKANRANPRCVVEKKHSRWGANNASARYKGETVKLRPKTDKIRKSGTDENENEKNNNEKEQSEDQFKKRASKVKRHRRQPHQSRLGVDADPSKSGHATPILVAKRLS